MQELVAIYNRIQPFIHKTPILHSSLLDEATHAQVYLKCESFQKTGSFKIRGATNAILCLSDAQRDKGVVTHSSGNFAQALSLAAKNLGVKAYIVMPSSAPEIKRKAVLGYDGIVTICEPTLEAREQTSAKIQQETGATFVHPSNDVEVINGQGTACYELLHEEQNFDYIITPIGGGGLIAGTCLFANAFSPNTIVIGAEPFAVDDAYRSLQSKKIETNDSIHTIADGLKTQLGNHNFPIILKSVQRIIRVTEEEIIAAMRFVWERMKVTIEPSSAVAVAAVFKETALFKNKKVGIIISGGNVDVTKLPF